MKTNTKATQHLPIKEVQSAMSLQSHWMNEQNTSRSPMMWRTNGNAAKWCSQQDSCWRNAKNKISIWIPFSLISQRHLLEGSLENHKVWMSKALHPDGPAVWWWWVVHYILKRQLSETRLFTGPDTLQYDVHSHANRCLSGPQPMHRHQVQNRWQPFQSPTSTGHDQGPCRQAMRLPIFQWLCP